MANTELEGAGTSAVALVFDGASATVPFEEDVQRRIERALPGYLAQRRWYRAKARPIEEVRIQDQIPLSGTVVCLVLEVRYSDGGAPDKYLLPLAVSRSTDEAVASSPIAETLALFRERSSGAWLVSSAFADAGFRSTLLDALVKGRSFAGSSGTLEARTVGGPHAIDSQVESAVSRAEQSNTSVIYGDQYILKLFRKVEEGINPDIEMGVFLTENGFAYTPAVAGTLEYKTREGGSYSAGLLQRFVANRGDAWTFTLAALSGFFKKALASDREPKLLGLHPLALAERELDSADRSLLEPYWSSARLLGQRTAEMHAVLARGTTSDFEPEPFEAKDGEHLWQEMQKEADGAFAVLRAKVDSLPAAASGDGREVLRLEGTVRERFASLRSNAVDARRIRFHGDYHLGQVLVTTAGDFVIIDFEGEPARPLRERRQKAMAMRDVAGMVRSFQYAAYAALFGQVEGISAEGSEDRVRPWSAFWFEAITGAYLQGYFKTAGEASGVSSLKTGGLSHAADGASHREDNPRPGAAGVSFVPSSADERRLLLDAFLLQKALYEVGYELNNRPHWVGIPLRGILDLIR